MRTYTWGMRRCLLTGPCLAGLAKIGSPWELALHTFDKFGNARVSGAEDVTVDVEGPQGTEIRTASVQDRGNGWYSVVLQLTGRAAGCSNPGATFLFQHVARALHVKATM